MAFKPEPRNRENILRDIEAAMNEQHGYTERASRSGGMKTGMEMSPTMRDSLISESQNAEVKVRQLKDLLGLYDRGEMSGGSSSSSSNPFGTGGSGGGGAPTVNTSNRFEAGLSDAELRLKNLLDNPDSINQSAAYKFRVGQGQEALQRSLGARGLLNSGNRLTELTKYGQDMASQEYDNQYNRLGSLLGNYSQGYTADKNSNVNLYGHQANAWNKAQENQDRVNIANKEIWSKRTPVPIPGISNGFRWV